MEAWPGTRLPELPGRGPRPRLYDTATGSHRRLPAEDTDDARMYVCGITPYDAAHMGHAATYVTFDILHRAWLDAGCRVTYVQNVTDVDDPLLERATATGEHWKALAERETQVFRDDMAALRVLPPTVFLGATEAIDLVAHDVLAMQQQGAVYAVDSDLYFSVDADPHFGSVAHRSRADMLEKFMQRGGDPQRPGKKNPLDPLVWRSARPGEPSWETPLGAGRPGWHIECTSMALSHLGPGFDVQGGGCDLSFPHHEMSASHASVLTEANPYARAFVHVGMVGLHGEKMSKSVGNMVFVSALRAEGIEPAAIRLTLLHHHYQHDWEWTAEEVRAAGEQLERWRAAMSLPAGPAADDVLSAVRGALAEDLDTPAALSAVDGWAQEALKGGGTDSDAPALMANVVDALLGVDARGME